MSATTETIKSTDELVQGDIVLTYGMRVRLDSLSTQKLTDRTVYSWTGTVLNLDEVQAEGRVPMSFLRTQKWDDAQGWVTDRIDEWTVQGNEWVKWAVQN